MAGPQLSLNRPIAFKDAGKLPITPSARLFTCPLLAVFLAGIWPGQTLPKHGKQASQRNSIQVKVTNNGTAPAGKFTVAWLSNQTEPGCSWTVSGLGVGESKDLDCNFTYTYQPASTTTFWITLVVDSNNQVTESNEGNNKRDAQITVEP